MNHTTRIPLIAAQIAMSADTRSNARPALACIHLDSKAGLIAASDGFRLSSVAWNDPDQDAGFPKSLLIPAKSVTDIARQAGKQAEHIEVRVPANGENIIHLSVIGKSGTEVSHVAIAVDATFPDVQQIYPRQEPEDAFWVDPDLMIKTLQAYKKAGAHSVRLERRSVGEHVTFKGHTSDGTLIDAMLMTMFPQNKDQEIGDNINPADRTHYTQAAD